MATTRASKLITVTEYGTGVSLNLSTADIISFQQIGANDTIIKHVTNRGKIAKNRVTETVSQVYALTETNTGTGVYLFQAITLADAINLGKVVYISNERVLILRQETTNATVLVDELKNVPAKYTFSTPTAADFNTAAGNTFAITTQKTNYTPSQTLYINNLKVKQVIPESPAVAPVITFTTHVKSATGAVTTAGTGYTSPTVSITGGGGAGATGTVNTKVITATVVDGGTGGTPGAVTITGTTGTGTKFQATGTINGSGILTGALVVSVAGDYSVPVTSISAEPVTGGSLSNCTVSLSLGISSFAITANGTGYTSYPTFGLVDATGVNGVITANMLVESPLVIVNAGKDVNANPTLAFSSGTTQAVATATYSALTQTVVSTSLSNAGAYKKGTDAYPTLVITSVAGAKILYDAKEIEFEKIQVAETVATIKSAINAL